MQKKKEGFKTNLQINFLLIDNTPTKFVSFYNYIYSYNHFSSFNYIYSYHYIYSYNYIYSCNYPSFSKNTLLKQFIPLECKYNLQFGQRISSRCKLTKAVYVHYVALSTTQFTAKISIQKFFVESEGIQINYR